MNSSRLDLPLRPLATTFFLAIQLMALSAFAYIPPSDFVLEQVTKNAGKNAFVIENEVSIRAGAETLTAREQWWIQDANTMRLAVRGPNLNLQVRYRDGKTEFLGESGKLVSKRTSPEMLERFFFARQIRTLADLLNQARVVSHDVGKPSPRFSRLSDVKHQNDPHSHLDRIGADVTIVLSQAQDPTQLASANGIWVDQANFAIRRLRFGPGTEMNAGPAQPLSQGLTMPRERVVTWPSGVAEIRILKVNSAAKLKDSDVPELTPVQYGTGPLSSVVKEFYSRFR